MKLEIFIPTYNCEKQIIRVLEKLDSTNITINVFDNNSTDKTLQIVHSYIQKKNATNINLFKNDINYGLGGTFKCMIKYCLANKVDYLFLLHGDDQTVREDIEKMINLAELNKPDVIWGERFAKDSKLINYSKIRELGNRVLNIFVSILLKKRIYELGSGLNCYRVSSLPLNEIQKWPSHIAFDMNLLFHFSNKKYNSVSLPIIWIENDQVSNARNFDVAYKIIKMAIKNHFGLKNLEDEQDLNFKRIN